MKKCNSLRLATIRRITVGMLIGMVLPPLAHAELGGAVASVENDAAHLKGTMRLTTAQTYMLHEIEAPTGHVVREYANTDGKVFGVTWEGPTTPDLRQLLGEHYFAALQQAIAKRPHYGRSPMQIETPEFVFQQTGHPRDFRGRAYLPQSLPAGLNFNAIR